MPADLQINVIHTGASRPVVSPRDVYLASIDPSYVVHVSQLPAKDGGLLDLCNQILLVPEFESCYVQRQAIGYGFRSRVSSLRCKCTTTATSVYQVLPREGENPWLGIEIVYIAAYPVRSILASFHPALLQVALFRYNIVSVVIFYHLTLFLPRDLSQWTSRTIRVQQLWRRIKNIPRGSKWMAQSQLNIEVKSQWLFRI